MLPVCPNRTPAHMVVEDELNKGKGYIIRVDCLTVDDKRKGKSEAGGTRAGYIVADDAGSNHSIV